MRRDTRCRVAGLVVFCVMLLGAYLSPRSELPLHRIAPRQLDCELAQELKPKNEPASWCPTFAHVYHCEDRVLVVSQTVDKDDPQVCIRVQVAQLVIGQGV